MSKLISGKEAKLAWFDGEELEIRENGTEQWVKLKESYPLMVFDCDRYELRIKTKTITINGIEVPAPFEPKEGERYYHLYTEHDNGYGFNVFESIESDCCFMQFGAWRTEEEIIAVVAALRSIFKP